MITSDFRKNMADNWFSYLQNQICKEFEFLENNKVKNYEFIIIAPAWYIDKNQIKKFRSYYSNTDYINLEKNYSYYQKNMKIQIDYFREILLETSRKN